MTWLQLVHDVVIAIMIIVGAMIFMTLVVRAVGEEQRRNSDHAIKLIDKSMDKIVETTVKAYKQISQLEKEEMGRSREIQNLDTQEQEKLRKEISELWK